MKITKTNSKKKLTIVILAAVALLVTLIAAVFLWWKPFETPTIEQPGGSVRLTAPTALEKDEADTRKETIEKRQSELEDTAQQTGLAEATPVITYVDQGGMNAFISGVYEDDGICTAKISKGSLIFEKTSNGFKDATTTGCSPIDFSPDDFAEKGEWQATLTYRSSKSAGTSKITKFMVN